MTFIFRISDQKDVGTLHDTIEVGMYQLNWPQFGSGHISMSQEQ